jgi:hypothetical protein
MIAVVLVSKIVATFILGFWGLDALGTLRAFWPAFPRQERAQILVAAAAVVFFSGLAAFGVWAR